MRVRLNPAVVLLVFANIFRATCYDKGSLAFVIDNTSTMRDDINQIKASADAITKIVFEERASQISDMVLVTFNDPHAHLVTVTKNRETLTNKINAIKLHDQYGDIDCLGMPMKGVLLALNKTQPGSYIYVFTDALAKDHVRSREIKNLCQKKQTQIFFVLTGSCGPRNFREPEFLVYYDIAAACSGLAFKVGKGDVNKVLATVKETIRGKKSLLTAGIAPPNVFTRVEFIIDEHIEYAIVTASGTEVSLTIDGPRWRGLKVMWVDNAKVMKLINPTPGIYTAIVRGITKTSVNVVGRTDFYFKHGFSGNIPKTLKDTRLRPIANVESYLSVFVVEPTNTVMIQFAQFLDMDEKVVGEFPLRQINKNFYVTNLFYAPPMRFKVAVIGRSVNTGIQIRRIGRIPVTVGPPNYSNPTPKSKKPVVSISEGSSTEVNYGDTVKLRCKVVAFPKPMIRWTNSHGNLVMSQNSVLELPYDYISYITISDISNSDKYKCEASNNMGTASKDIEVTVKEPFDAISTIKGTTELQYGKKGRLRCDIRAPVPMQIKWYHKNKNTGRNQRLISSKKYSITTDGVELTIKTVNGNDDGLYSCKASLINDENKSVVYKTIVKVSGLMAPNVKGVNDKTIVKGSNIDIDCQVTGMPIPAISWQFMGKDSSKFVSIEGSDSVLRISSVDEKHAGLYKCTARNILNIDEHITTLTVQVPPKILSNSEVLYKAVEGKNTQLNIPCATSGNPKPTITWSLNGELISTDDKYSIEEDGLVIKDPKASDSQTYVCKASNEAGTVQATFQTRILQPPKVLGDIEITRKVGSIVNIACVPIKGVPSVTMSWQFMGKNSSRFVSIESSDYVLRISSADEKHAGRYKCIAHNVVGDDEHVTTLTVILAPAIISNHSTTYKGLEGDVALRIPCDAVGIPQPVITWRKNDAVITSDEKYAIQNGALIIKDPKKSDSMSYTCEAKNFLGSADATFKAVIDDHLEDFGTIHEVNMLDGETKKLECGTDGQSVRWFKERKFLEIRQRYFELNEVEVSQEGNYTCRVSDMNGGHTETFTVRVDLPPEFIVDQENILFDWTGDEDDVLNCAVEARPAVNVVWTYNGKQLSENSTRLAVNGKWGHYTCNVSNAHGALQRSFNVTSSQCLIPRQPKNNSIMPLILTTNSTWPVFEATTDYLKVGPGQTYQFTCLQQEGQKNNFQNIPERNEITATCDKQDTFLVEGTPYNVSDLLQCAHEVKSVVIEKGSSCLTKSSKLMQVGFQVHGFLETYEICFDTSKNIPLYTRVLMSKSNIGRGITPKQYSGFDVGRLNDASTCETPTSSCCYSKMQLVNVRDVSDGPAQESTFLDPLNAVPYWRPCDSNKSPWEDIEDMVRSQLRSFNQFIAWSGTHKLQDNNGISVPRYLWKVLRFNKDESIAMVYVNGASPTTADVLCNDICADGNVPWIYEHNKHIYCCNVDDFLQAFGLRETTIGEPMEVALDKIQSKE